MPSPRLLRISLGVAAMIVALGGPATDARTAWAPIHDYRGVVPVLVYHGINVAENPARDPYSVTPSEFARQMAMLSATGFNAISIEQYARFAGGDLSTLPNRPILITFDDSRTDSQGADNVLARYGMRATMFVITANAAGPKQGYLGWAMLAAMAASGRWDVQEHANAGHALIPTGPRNQTGPYYANLLYRNGKRETFTAFKRRVSGDILAGRRLLSANIQGFQPFAFAAPYGNYGQARTNYAPIRGWAAGWLKRTFEVVFVQDRRTYNLPGNPIGQRYGVRATTTAAALHDWLTRALPASALTTPSSRPRRPSARRKRVGAHSVVIVFRRRARAAVQVTRRRAGYWRTRSVSVSPGGRMRDHRLRPRTVYIYRALAVSPEGRRSRVLRLRVRTHSR
jgi:peptidoglycan/xylan/chitin deacetylase (PgdA/CDA1 family)